MTQREARSIAHKMAASFIKSLIDTVEGEPYTDTVVAMIQSELEDIAAKHAHLGRHAPKTGQV